MNNLELQVGRFYLNKYGNIIPIVKYDSSHPYSYIDQKERRYNIKGKNALSKTLSLKSEYKEHLKAVDEPENRMITDWLDEHGDEEISKQVDKELMELHFPEIIEERIKKIQESLANKAKEYATDGQSFYNFDRAAKINRTSAKKALWGMATKHLVSVIDMVEQDKSFGKAYVDEKIGDMINYLILLEGLLKRDSKE